MAAEEEGVEVVGGVRSEGEHASQAHAGVSLVAVLDDDSLGSGLETARGSGALSAAGRQGRGRLGELFTAGGSHCELDDGLEALAAQGAGVLSLGPLEDARRAEQVVAAAELAADVGATQADGTCPQVAGRVGRCGRGGGRGHGGFCRHAQF